MTSCRLAMSQPVMLTSDCHFLNLNLITFGNSIYKETELISILLFFAMLNGIHWCEFRVK